MDPKTFQFIFITAYGMEYRCTMLAVGDFPGTPPVFVEEIGEHIMADGVNYLDLDGFASCHGCVMQSMVSLETN